MAFGKSALEGVVMLSADFWHKKNVLITGHTGFKGGWLAYWLKRLGADVTGIALQPRTTPNFFDAIQLENDIDSHFCDIRDRVPLDRILKRVQPEIVFHLAAQPLVRASYQDPIETFATNVMGTANLLDALRAIRTARVAVMVTTDKVYLNREWVFPYREDDPLGGHDPYSASKAASEIIISSYSASFLSEQGLAVASARAGNVIGGGDWSEDRLIPDAVRAWGRGDTLHIRRPHAIRPWQHVLEPLAGYLALAQRLWHEPALAGAFNFGPETSEAATVREVVDLARAAYSGGEVFYGDGSEGPHEAGWLALEVAKARTLLGLKPRWRLEEAIRRTMSWYKAFEAGADARHLCDVEIGDYETAS